MSQTTLSPVFAATGRLRPARGALPPPPWLPEPASRTAKMSLSPSFVERIVSAKQTGSPFAPKLALKSKAIVQAKICLPFAAWRPRSFHSSFACQRDWSKPPFCFLLSS